MSEIIDKKEKIRKEYILIRNNINNKKEKSNIIKSKVIAEEVYKKAKVIAIYKNLKSEVDTEEIIKHSFKYGKKIVLPKVENESMNFYEIKSINETLIKSKFGVYEPEGLKEKIIEKEDIDLMIVPGICFDKKGNRLGFGKGYYDKYLENSKIYTIGICFRDQLIQKSTLPVNDKDIKMNKVITD